MTDLVSDLLAFIDRSPTPYHAVAETRRRIESAGYRGLEEGEVWDLSSGDCRYIVRGDGSLLAFQVGTESPATGGFHIVGAHTDSPNLRLKPLADLSVHGYRQLAVEPYGGVLLHTWLDRDLSLAGRVTLDGAARPRTVLIDFGRPLLRIPNLAIHLQREIHTDGLKLNAQTHLIPVAGLDDAPALAELVAEELRAQKVAEVEAKNLLAFELMTYDVQPSGLTGARREFICAPRLDNLASCHAAITALTRAARETLPPFTRAVVLYDHEEVGSRSAQGAAGTLLAATLDRVVAAFKGGSPQGTARAMANSFLISADMAHAIHPNFPDRHEPGHRPVLGNGPVIKVNANQGYASDAETAGYFADLCRRRDVVPQHFVARSDLACGSTIGPVSAARVGIRTVDVGNPMLSMHSCREMAGSADVGPMVDVLGAFFEA